MAVVGNNLNDFAWDYAGNLYSCGNSGEKIVAWAMPRTADEVVSTPAASKYTFHLGELLPEYTITATNPEAVNDTYQSVACAAQNGTITVRDYIAGDVSGDGILNRADLVMFARYFARYEDASGINMAAADVTGDGTVNRGDLVKLARYFAKLETSLG